MSWAQERAEHAADRILDAAERLFAERGVGSVGMADVARAAGCSRATLYRYFESRTALRTAYVHREARRIVATVAEHLAGPAPAGDPAERRAEAILRTVHEVRARPELVTWLAPGEGGLLDELLAGSDVVAGLVADFLGDDADPALGRWLLRVVLSYVVVPGAAEEERQQVRDFLVPLLSGQVR